MDGNDEKVTEVTSDSKFLKLIGKEAESVAELKIQDEVKITWQKFMSEGIPEQVKTSITAKYPRRQDLFVEAPNVNLEVQPVLTEIAKKRD